MNVMPKLAEWTRRIRGLPPSVEADRAAILLRAYHAKREYDKEGAMEMVSQIEGICHATCDQMRDSGVKPLPAHYNHFAFLGLSCFKQLRDPGWGTVRKLFGPKGGVHGAAKSIHHHAFDGLKVTPDPARPEVTEATAQGNYWLEAVDPHHRSWAHNHQREFEEWLQSGIELSLWEWLLVKGMATDGVRYLLNDEERGRYAVSFKGSTLYWTDFERGKAEAPLDTSGVVSAHGHQDCYIWVCSPQGVFYTRKHQLNAFHHSSFLGGGAILGGGEWKVTGGAIQWISNKTGHYATNSVQTSNALRVLGRKVKLGEVPLGVYDAGIRGYTWVKAGDFVAKSGNVATSAPFQGAKPF